jgi:cyclic pyranopterin phosphate synthase
LTQRDVLDDVLAGLEVARNCGLTPIKINMVWLPDLNGDEIDAMIEYCMERGFVLRLIERMPMGVACPYRKPARCKVRSICYAIATA